MYFKNFMIERVPHKTILTSFFVIFSIISIDQVYAQPDSCQAVLEITGRENRITMSNELKQEYAEHQRSNARDGSAGISYAGVGVTGSSASSQSSKSTEWSEWKAAYFEAHDRVFAPAVEAWLSCINARTARVKYNIITNHQVDIDITAGNGIDRLNLTEIRAGTEVSCSNTRRNAVAYSVVCSRRSGSRAIRIVIRTDFDTFVITMPKINPPYRPYKSDIAQYLGDVSACNFLQKIPSVDYPRDIFVEQFSMYAEGSDGGATVSINGQVVTRSTGSRPPGNIAWGTPATRGGIRVPANIPIIVLAAGGTNGGGRGCIKLLGKIKGS